MNTEESSKERIVKYINFKGISKSQFYNDLDIKRGLLDTDKLKATIPDTVLAKILVIYSDLNIGWLLTGEGEMLLSLPQTSINTGGNNISGNIGGSVNTGMGNHMVHITMPESGAQKIIKPTGEVEIQRTDPTKSEDTKEAELSKEIELMKQRVALMEDNMKMKDELIASLKETIELLRNRQ